jgi:hypothetical protein
MANFIAWWDQFASFGGCDLIIMEINRRLAEDFDY